MLEELKKEGVDENVLNKALEKVIEVSRVNSMKNTSHFDQSRRYYGHYNTI